MTEWDDYWTQKAKFHHKLYDKVAIYYRKYIIKPYLTRYLNKHFQKGSILLHAGCGSGQLDEDLIQEYEIIGIDSSKPALELYKNYNENYVYGDILNTKFKSETFDGIYNLGVMEHFTTESFRLALREFKRILKPDGKIILFVPPEYGSTVIFFKIVNYILNNLLKKNIYFQPPEINRVIARGCTEKLVNSEGFELVSFDFEPSDLFTHVAIVIKKN